MKLLWGYFFGRNFGRCAAQPNTHRRLHQMYANIFIVCAHMSSRRQRQHFSDSVKKFWSVENLHI